MKFTDINSKQAGSEDIFLKLIKEKIHPSFKEVSRDISTSGAGKKLILKSVKFKAVNGRKILELTLILRKKMINHLWLSMEKVETFYGVHGSVTMKRLEIIAPILRNFICYGLVNETICTKVEGSQGNDWPLNVRPRKEKFALEAA